MPLDQPGTPYCALVSRSVTISFGSASPEPAPVSWMPKSTSKLWFGRVALLSSA
jgi:hypothetical protein